MSFSAFANACLRPPGEGVYTVSNAKERKENLHQLLYGKKNEVTTSWQTQLAQKLSPDFSGVAVLGVCSDTGGSIQRGANWGPLFLREQMYQDHWPVLDLGDVFIIPQLLHDKYLNAETIAHVRQAVYGDENSAYPVSPLSITEETVHLFNREFPKAKLFSMGGDHSVSYPLVKAWAQAPSRRGKRIGLIHFDAHTDLMTERLGIDLCFATWVPAVLPFFKDAANVYQIGIRSSGQEKSHWENTFGIHQLWAKEIHDQGLSQTLESFERYLVEKKFEEVYVSFDIDALDITYAGATGTPESGGLAPHEAKMFLDILGKHCRVSGADMVEVAPFVNIDDNPQGQWSTLQSASLLSRALTDLLERS